MPQWNSDIGGHVGLSKLLARFGISALRLSLPYHDRRMPPELRRADYIVSSNVARTLEVCRQAVHDARRAVWWLEQQGYERIGILGTSLGSCLAMLTAAHEPRISAQALNHALAVLRGRRVAGSLDRARAAGIRWLPSISSSCAGCGCPSARSSISSGSATTHAARLRAVRPDVPGRSVSEDPRECRRRGIPHKVRVLPCGHYTTGVGAVQVPRRLHPHEVSSQEPLITRVEGSQSQRVKESVEKPSKSRVEEPVTFRPCWTLRLLDRRDQRYLSSPASAP